MSFSQTSFCEVCKVPLTGIAPAQQHYASERHKKRVLQLEEKQLVPEVAQVNTPAAEDLPEKEYEFNGIRGFCHVCMKELTSKIVAEQHVAGKSHKKAQMSWELKKTLNALHQSNIVGTLSSGVLNEAISTATTKSDPMVQPNAGETVTSNKCFRFDLDAERGDCLACNLQFSKFLDFQRHLKTDEHKLQEEEWRTSPQDRKASSSQLSEEATKIHVPPTHVAPIVSVQSLLALSSIDNTLWYDCNVCNKRLNTAKQLELHMKSPKHKKLEERRNEQVNLNAADQTIWKTCHVCNKKLNSHDQLQIHLRSHGIKQSELAEPEKVVQNESTCRALNFDSEQKKSMETETSKINDNDTTAQGWASGWNQSAGHVKDVAKDDSDITALCKLEECHLSEEPETNEGHSSSQIGIASGENTSSDVPDWYTHHCYTCNKHFTGEKSLKQHLNGKEHMKKDAVKSSQADSSNPYDTFRFYCHICDVPLNTEKDEQSHKEGKKHLEKMVKACKAPNRKLPSLKKAVLLEECMELNLTEFTPRAYQVELYKKAMTADSVCFLPTGTGKTLVAVMVLSHMLRKNPYHSALFLVDKNLLGIQQFQFINQQIGDKTFTRYDHDQDKLVERQLRISLVCSGRQDTAEGLAMWKQDIVVATAAFYENLLLKGNIHWEDNCLVILDESHHCTKEHPYQQVMKDFHCVLKPESRPKILGLTASPAGKDNVVETKIMLRQLLHNLGDVRMVAVDKEQDELQNYCSTTKLMIKKIDLSENEERFKNVLQKYMLLCCEILVAETNINEFDEAKLIEQYLTEDLTEELQRDLVIDVANSILELMDKRYDSIIPKHQNRFELIKSLKDHTKVIAEGLVTIRELGLECAVKNLNILSNKTHTANFSCAKKMLKLNCDPVIEILENYGQLQVLDIKDLGNLEVESLPIVKQLLSDILTEVNWEVTSKRRPMVLVLVRRRKDVYNLKEILTKSELLKKRNIKTVSVMGHAAKTTEGMTIKQQDKAMSQIKEHAYQVIVATSIAEEGLDLPECELVVQLDPPDNVKSLVQIRGRARKKNSKFIALCRDERQVQSLESLQEREGYMIEAVQQIVTGQDKVENGDTV